MGIQGYGTGTMAPGIIGPGTTAYEADFKATQGGKVGITLNVNWCEPRDPSDQADITASGTCMNFNLGWYAHAIFVDGKYPEVMRLKIDDKSEAQGFEESRLPHFSDED